MKRNSAAKRLRSNYGSNRWVQYSVKLQRNVIAFSILEYLHILLVEWTVGIKSYLEQPCRIRMFVDGCTVTTIPDMLIVWRSGCLEYREVKYSEELRNGGRNSRAWRQIAAQKKWCGLQRVEHSVVTEQTIKAKPIYLENCQMMLRYLACTQHLDLSRLQNQLTRMLSTQGARSLREIEDSFPHINVCQLRAAVFGLIHAGHASADTEEKALRNSTMVALT